MSEKEPASHEELVRFLEQQSGRSIKSREDIRAYLTELAQRNAGENPRSQVWLRAKQITLFGLMAFAFIQYYMIDVLLEIASLPTNTYFLPAGDKGEMPKALDRT